MSLTDFDRKPTTITYGPWGRDVTLRPIGASDLIRLRGLHEQVHEQSGGTEGLIKFYSELLAVAVIDPAEPASEWEQCQLDTLTALGMEALKVCGLAKDEAKKN